MLPKQSIKCGKNPQNIQWKRKQSILLEETLLVFLATCWLRCWWQSDVNKHTTGNMEVCKNDRGRAQWLMLPMEVKDKEVMWMMTWLRHRLGKKQSAVCVVQRGRRTTAQRQPGHSEVFTYLLTVTWQKYLTLPPWMRHLIWIFMNTMLTLWYCYGMYLCFWIILAGRNRFWWGIFFFPDVISGYSFD